MHRSIVPLIATAATVFTLDSSLFAQAIEAPPEMPVPGSVYAPANGMPVADGNHQFKFQLYSDAAGTTAVGPEITKNLTTDKGLFFTSLDFGTAFDTPGRRWMKITMDNQALGPPEELLASPFSLVARRALDLRLPFLKTVNVANPNIVIELTNQGNGRVMDLVGNVPTPNMILRVENQGNGAGIQVSTKANSPEPAIKVFNTGTGDGMTVVLTVPPGTRGAVGVRTHTVIKPPSPPAERPPDISPEQFATGGGSDFAAASPAVVPCGGNLRGGGGGECTPIFARMVDGDHIGLWAMAGANILAEPYADSRAVQAHARNGIAVYGSTNFPGYPDGALSSNVNAVGVKGFSYDGTALMGESPSGKAGKFIGNVDVTGILTVNGNKQFCIDHPLDPQGKTLSHACVESDQMVNMYRGNVTLNANGAALIELPEWFTALNGDLNYQLTCVGGYAPVFIAREVGSIHGQPNQFAIAGGKPGLKVSWQITGVRQDRFALEHPLVIEQPKHPNAEVDR